MKRSKEVRMPGLDLRGGEAEGRWVGAWSEVGA